MTKSDPWVICNLCNGNGNYVNPNIDSHGLTAEDFNDDPDFAEDYQAGVYNITCHRCNGSGKIKQSKQNEINDNLANEIEDRRTRARENGDVEEWLTASDPRYNY